MNLLYSAKHHLVARDIVIRPEYVGSTVISVDMCRNEINRDLIFVHVRQKLRNPGGLRCGRTTHLKLGRYRFDCARSVIVEIPIGGLLRYSSPEVQVGFVPYFEFPRADLVDSIASDEVSGKCTNHFVPELVIFRRRNNRVIEERMESAWIGGQLSRHEAQFNEGLDTPA